LNYTIVLPSPFTMHDDMATMLPPSALLIKLS
jgi:hypothetical protein